MSIETFLLVSKKSITDQSKFIFQWRFFPKFNTFFKQPGQSSKQRKSHGRKVLRYIGFYHNAGKTFAVCFRQVLLCTSLMDCQQIVEIFSTACTKQNLSKANGKSFPCIMVEPNIPCRENFYNLLTIHENGKLSSHVTFIVYGNVQ